MPRYAYATTRRLGACMLAAWIAYGCSLDCMRLQDCDLVEQWPIGSCGLQQAVELAQLEVAHPERARLRRARMPDHAHA